jgi:hypothetical protein
LYLPASSVTEVPLEDPANDFGEGLLPDTVTVKAEGENLPPITFVVTVKKVFEPLGGNEIGFFVAADDAA